MQSDRTVGLWMYQNGGGDMIEQKIILNLLERGINSVTGLDLRFANASSGSMLCKGVELFDLDLFFSYNAGEQTQSQVYFYKQLDRVIPTLNSFSSFELTEDKYATCQQLSQQGVRTTDYFLCHRETPELILDKLKEWKKLVFKPLDGYGGMGMALIDSEHMLNALMPFLNSMDIRHYYIERFIENDFTDFRIDIVNGHYIGCYGRQARENDWRTNVTSGGHVIMRDPDDTIINLAKRAAKATGLEIAGVDIIYDMEREEYVVLEVNGIPAFATPDQEAFGLNFNDKKIEKIVELIDATTKKG